jgi:hypothetical protein
MSQKRGLPPRPKKEITKDDEQSSEENVEDNLEENIDETLEETPRKTGPREKPTMEGHIANYNKLFTMLDEEISRKSREKEKGVRVLRSVRKTLDKMRKELPKVARSKAAKIKSSSGRRGGITIQLSISPELCEFLQLPENSKITRLDATRAICVYSHLKDDEKREELLKWKHLNPKGKRNLQSGQDGRIIIPDSKLSKLLKYKQYQKDVSKGKILKKTKKDGKIVMVPEATDSLYYYTIQRLLSPHFFKG